MDDPARRLVWQPVTDECAIPDRAERLAALLATALERLLTSTLGVDFNADVSVHPDMPADRSPW